MREGQPEEGYNFHKDTDSSAVISLSDRNEYNSQHRLRQSLAAVWYHTPTVHTSLLMSPIGSTGPVVHLHGLTRSVKSQL